ncbi:hypothetical protein [Actinokineospora enzanensis]|uniref:hypothetical protein n=1 Tax=Actinokineospora enzanensis TaxID=155975 RepID=UPI00036143B8|nr:hypothetical protein [Actinokineospora enzanensis]
MSIFTKQGVSVDLWIEMAETVPMHVEVDPPNQATIHFGSNSDYVVVLCRENLVRLAEVATEALCTLDAELSAKSSVGGN